MLGQLAVDMPTGYFGGSDSATGVGRSYAWLLVGLLLLGLEAFRGNRRTLLWSLPVPAMLSLNVGLFIAPLVSDPIVAGLVVAWNAYLLARFLAPSPTPGERELMASGEAHERWLSVNGPAVRHLNAVTLVAATLLVGLEMGEGRPVRLLVLGSGVLAAGSAVPFLLALARRRARLALVILALLCAAAAAGPVRTGAALACLSAAQVLILALLSSYTPLVREVLDSLLERPVLLLLGSFLALIAVGTLLLTFPAAAAGGSIAPIDALFTATSAACVTGLIVLDTPHQLSLFGQATVLALIQAGGLSIMVLSTFAAILLGRGVGLKGGRALQELLDLRAMRSAERLVVLVIITTIALEAVGALILGAAFAAGGMRAGQAAWHGVFHAVSAFCNAGFALHSDSLVGFQRQPVVLGTIASLITLGGLGFAVLASAWLRVTGRERLGLAIQVRLVLRASVVLVVLGWVFYAACEWNHSLAGLGPGGRVANALFQSVTTRTAGFNSVPLDHLQPATILAVLLLMFVGASPGSTGGGIKTTTLAVLVAAVPALASGRARALFFGRYVSSDTLARATAILIVSFGTVAAGTLLLLLSQTGRFEALLFEAVSAFGTVGLSLGATATLNAFGKLVIVCLMLAGRIGPLSVALLLGQRRRSRVGYATTDLMVG